MSLGLILLSFLPATTFPADLPASQLYRTGRYAECIDIATQGLANPRSDESLYVLKLRSEMELGRYADAQKTLDQGLQKLPNSLQLRWLGREVCRFNGQATRALRLTEELAHVARAVPLRQNDITGQLMLGRLFLNQGVDPKRVLEAIYDELRRRQPNSAEPCLAIGELALEKHDYALAAESFEQALALDAADPEAHYGLARACLPGDSVRAQAALKAALDLNSNHVPSLLVVADGQIDAERYDSARETLDRIARINPHHPMALAHRAVLAHLRNEPEDESRFRDEALRFWTANPAIDSLIGKKLSQKYRFAEGAAYQRRALGLDPEYRPAKIQLAQDLLRLGDEQEGWRLADEVARQDGYDVVAHNLTTLHESVAGFSTIEEGGFVLRMDSREARLYGRRVIDVLKRARAHLCEKYDVAIDKPVIVELFPRQQDFAIRTFGLPGGDGFLGVCFGTVITANSPASQGGRPASWEATLWHEFCHVVTLHKTHNRMPRWLSEGISVYEERQADPTWGQSINPKSRRMLLGDELTPVSELSGAFLNPRSPEHLQFAYLESSLVVEYLVERHGLDVLKRILVDLGAGMPVNESLARYTGSLEQLNAEFAEFARKRALEIAPDVDWSEPELPRQANRETLAAWLDEHPRNYPGWQRLARQLIVEKRWASAKLALERMRRMYPEDSSADNPYALLARVHRELGETSREQAMLERLAELSASDIGVFERLAELTAAAGDWADTRKFALRWLAVNPLHAAPHRYAARAAEHLQDDPLAIESCQALLLLEPIDPAEVHLRLATALERTGDLSAARRHALMALEDTPRYRAAQKRLLQIVRRIEQGSSASADKLPESPLSTSSEPHP